MLSKAALSVLNKNSVLSGWWVEGSEPVFSLFLSLSCSLSFFIALSCAFGSSLHYSSLLSFILPVLFLLSVRGTFTYTLSAIDTLAHSEGLQKKRRNCDLIHSFHFLTQESCLNEMSVSLVLRETGEGFFPPLFLSPAQPLTASEVEG